MPTVAIEREVLFREIGQRFSDDEFRTLCFEFGIELDDITTTAEQLAKGERTADDIKDVNQAVVYKIDIPANRYDLLCTEGISRALRVFLKKEQPPKYTVLPFDEKNGITLTVKSNTQGVRPFAVGAVLRGVTFTAENYKSFMDLQDKLHQNLGRKRTLCAIGTHDLDTIKAPFVYDARPPADIKFVALEQNGVARTVPELFKMYKETGNKLRAFLHITENKQFHPVILDSKETVLSLPPIINGDHSRIEMHTKNVFIECTGMDLTKLTVVLNTVLSMFSQYSKFTIEPVKVVYEHNKKAIVYPDLSNRTVAVDVDTVNRTVGIDMKAEEMAKILTRMQLPAVVDAKSQGKTLSVEVPPTRSDVLHPVDIIEDVAIAYGYNNIKKTVPKTTTVGKPDPLNKLSDLLRVCVATCGYTEVLTWILVNNCHNTEKMLIPEANTAVRLANAVNKPKENDPNWEEGFDACRTHLIQGLLRTLKENKGVVSLPIKLFEVGDVVELCAANAGGLGGEVGARNRRKLAACFSGMNSGFEQIHGLVDRIMEQNLYQFVIDPETPQGKAFAEQQAALDGAYEKHVAAKKADAEKKAKDAAEAAAKKAAKEKDKKSKPKAADAAAAPAAAGAGEGKGKGKDKGKGKGDKGDAKGDDKKDQKAGAAAAAGAGAGAGAAKDKKGAKAAPAAAKEAEPEADEEGDDAAAAAEHERLRIKALLKGTYFLRKSEHPSFLDKVRADVWIVPKGQGIAQAKRIGTLGIVHPQVLIGYKITHPTSAVELDVEAFL